MLVFKIFFSIAARGREGAISPPFCPRVQIPYLSQLKEREGGRKEDR